MELALLTFNVELVPKKLLKHLSDKAFMFLDWLWEDQDVTEIGEGEVVKEKKIVLQNHQANHLVQKTTNETGICF